MREQRGCRCFQKGPIDKVTWGSASSQGENQQYGSVKCQNRCWLMHEKSMHLGEEKALCLILCVCVCAYSISQAKVEAWLDGEQMQAGCNTSSLSLLHSQSLTHKHTHTESLPGKSFAFCDFIHVALLFIGSTFIPVSNRCPRCSDEPLGKPQCTETATHLYMHKPG